MILSVEHKASKSVRLFTLSGRSEEGLNNVLDQIHSKHPHDIELQSLLQETCNSSPATHPYRGYILLNTHEKITETQVTL